MHAPPSRTRIVLYFSGEEIFGENPAIRNWPSGEYLAFYSENSLPFHLYMCKTLHTCAHKWSFMNCCLHPWCAPPSFLLICRNQARRVRSWDCVPANQRGNCWHLPTLSLMQICPVLRLTLAPDRRSVWESRSGSLWNSWSETYSIWYNDSDQLILSPGAGWPTVHLMFVHHQEIGEHVAQE